MGCSRVPGIARIEFLSQMHADKSNERFSQMDMAVDSIAILRQCYPHRSAPRLRSPAANLLRVDRLRRSITQPVKNETSAVIMVLIRFYLR